MAVERTPTGIEGLDELIEGGLPKGNSLLIAGSSGTGKTILASQIAYNKAKEGDNALYITFEEDEEKLIRQMEGLGFEVRELIKKDSLTLYPIKGDFDIAEAYKDVKKIVEDKKIVVLVLDSLTMMIDLGRRYSLMKEIELEKVEQRMSPGGSELTRNNMSFIIRMIERLGVTPIFIDEADEKGDNITKLGVAEFVCDGVITMHYVLVGVRRNRSLMIRKMRETEHDDAVHPIEIIRSKGIVVKEVEDAYKEV